jgi:hypothetical protein
MTCDRHQALEDLVTAITDALNARGRAIQAYRDEVERDLVWEAAALAARFLGRPTRTFDKPGALHVVVTGWTYDPVQAELEVARIRRVLDAALAGAGSSRT